jgi:hypothetical protein
MCKLSNLYVVDLFDSTSTGGIEWNVANVLPKLMYNKCKIVVKQIQTELKDTVSVPNVDISTVSYLRVIHNINIQSGSNGASSNSNILANINTFQARNTSTTTTTYTNNVTPTANTSTTNATNIIGYTETNCILYAPNGLPPILKLNRAGIVTLPTILPDGIVDAGTLFWSVRLEITINPDEE